ncbi:hypothetical protein E2P81_ATG06262 [Venturia nashicola]|nr:hypothetical protein E2P81_ATG06262 [Venturia nashicola]
MICFEASPSVERKIWRARFMLLKFWKSFLDNVQRLILVGLNIEVFVLGYDFDAGADAPAEASERTGMLTSSSGPFQSSFRKNRLL